MVLDRKNFVIVMSVFDNKNSKNIAKINFKSIVSELL